MMIPLQEILNKYNISPKGVIQVGSHYAEEHEEFVKCGIERFVYIEPCKEAFNKIIDKFEDYVFCGSSDGIIGVWRKDGQIISLVHTACGSEEKEMPMYVSHQNQGQSNSLLKPELHTQQHPEVVFDDAEIVKVVPLDNLPIKKEDYDFLYMDVQGAEGLVLKGATETLKRINIIYTECNRGQTYYGNMEIEEMDLFLAEHGFKRVETFWPSPSLSWGDAVYVKPLSL